MRPALAALAEQQKLLDRQNDTLAVQARLLDEALQVISHLYKSDQRKTAQLKQLTRGLAAVSSLTGLEDQVRTAIYKRADEQNPAQPVPDPSPEPPLYTTQEVETPEAYADVRAPGLVPGTNNDTAADATSTTYTPGLDLDTPALNRLDDVTRPIDGTQGPRPLSETKTLTDVRVGDPMNAQVAFPVGGPFSQSQRTSAANVANARAVSSLRLARLRVATATTENDEMVEMDSIVRDASLSDDMIAREIAILEKTKTASAKQVDAPRNLVPRSASVRTVPQLTRTALSDSGDDDAELIFLGEV